MKLARYCKIVNNKGAVVVVVTQHGGVAIFAEAASKHNQIHDNTGQRSRLVRKVEPGKMQAMEGRIVRRGGFSVWTGISCG